MCSFLLWCSLFCQCEICSSRPSWCRRMCFAKLISFLWKRHFCPGHGWMQSKIYLSCQSWNVWRYVIVFPGRVPCTDCVYQLDHIPRISGKEKKMAPLWREDVWFCMHKDQSGATQKDSVYVQTLLSKEMSVRGFFPWKGLQRNSALKMLGWKHICVYNLLNRCKQDFIRSSDGSRQIQSCNQSVT